MKRLAIFAAVLSVSQVATAASLICYDQTSSYYVSLADHWDTGVVQSNGVTLPFGNLVCTEGANTGGTLLASCTSAGSVRDAGFVVYFNFANTRSIVATLYQMSFAGLKPVASLPCYW
jgi:hypothetical protein